MTWIKNYVFIVQQSTINEHPLHTGINKWFAMVGWWFAIKIVIFVHAWHKRWDNHTPHLRLFLFIVLSIS